MEIVDSQFEKDCEVLLHVCKYKACLGSVFSGAKWRCPKNVSFANGL